MWESWSKGSDPVNIHTSSPKLLSCFPSAASIALVVHQRNKRDTLLVFFRQLVPLWVSLEATAFCLQSAGMPWDIRVNKENERSKRNWTRTDIVLEVT